MNKIKIYLGDLEHTWEKVNTWTFPLNVGYVGTYAKKNMPNDVDVTLFKDPFELIELVKNNGGLKYSSEIMKNYQKEALDILDQFPNSDAKNSLKLLVNYVINRKK